MKLSTMERQERLIKNYEWYNRVYKILLKRYGCISTNESFKVGQTPFDNINEIINSEKGHSCGSGDNFVTGEVPIKVDVVDMEAYAIAKVCKLENINFRCFKFISDNADESAGSDWIKNCEKAFELFKYKLKEITSL